MGELRSLFLIVSIGLMAICPSWVCGQAENPQLTVSDLNKVSVHDLVEMLDTAPHGWWNDDEIHHEAVLIELLKRKDMEVGELLAAKLEQNKTQLADAKELLQELQQDDSKDDEYDEQCDRVYEFQCNLELMTTLRRWEEKPDSLMIEVSIPETGIKGRTRELPEIKVTLKNVDSGREPIWLFVSGENTHFKHSGLRIHVWDSSGQRIPVRIDNLRTSRRVGSTQLLIQRGEKHEASLAMDAYVDIPKPGRYTCQIIYANANAIANFECEGELDELIVFQSTKFDVEIEQGPFIEISLTKDVATQAKKLVDELKGKYVAVILDEEYTEQFHGFIDPESPEGKLLTLKWKAVPALLERLENRDLNVHERAFIFGLLYSISREQHLFPPGEVLGFYRQNVEGGFGGGFGPRNAAKQQAFAEEWLKFRDDYIRISYSNE